MLRARFTSQADGEAPWPLDTGVILDLLCAFKSCAASLSLSELATGKQLAQPVTYLLPQEPADEIMSINPSLRRKGHGNRRERGF